jgi:hypothetical protein
MNLSRAAKKFRDQKHEPEAPKKATAGAKPGTPPPPPTPAPAPVVRAPEPIPAPLPEPTVPAAGGGPAPPPKKERPVKAKRPRFVREKAGKQERTAVPPLSVGSTKPAARLLTKNLALLPKDAPTANRF